MAMVTAEMFEDVTKCGQRIRIGQWTLVATSPRFAFPDVEGFTSDAAICVIADPTTNHVIKTEGGSLHLFGMTVGLS